MPGNWMAYALLSAVFAALVAVLGKIGLKNVDSSLATGIRAFVMFAFLFVVLLIQKKYLLLGTLQKQDYLFIVLSGIAGAVSWLFYFFALKAGEATKVASVDRLSIVFVMIFALLFLGEKFSIRAAAGILLIAVGTILVIL